MTPGGSGAPLAVRVEVLSPVHLRGEIQEDGDPLKGNSALLIVGTPILEELTTRWGLGPHPRRMWFEIEAD